MRVLVKQQHTHTLEIMYAMSLGNPGKQVVVDTLEAAQDGAFDVGKQLVGCLLSRFTEFMSVCNVSW